MGKVIDITEKLSMEENPRLKINKKEYEVNADAETILKIMGLFEDKSDERAATEAAGLLFNEKDYAELKKKLSFKDLMLVIQAAVQIASGNEEAAEGEVQTHTTT